MVTASDERLQLEAERVELEMRRREDVIAAWEGRAAYADFSLATAHLFDRSTSNSMFTSLERGRLVWSILSASRADGGCDLDLDALLEDEVLQAAFTLHDDVARDRLRTTWATWTTFSLDQPLDAVRDYFGEHEAFYFAWLTHYSKALILPSGVGILVALWESFWDPTPLLLPGFCLFMSVWATLYLEFWKRRRAELAYHWDCEDFAEEEVTRPQFVGEPTPGIYLNGVFVQSSDAPTQLYFPPAHRASRVLVAILVLLPFAAAVTIGALAILFYRGVVSSTLSPTVANAVGAVATGLWVLATNHVFKQLALWLNSWENHRTNSAFEDSLIVKTFLFRSVNTFSTLLYLVFVKPKEIKILGAVDYCRDPAAFDKPPDQIRWEHGGGNPFCMQELYVGRGDRPALSEAPCGWVRAGQGGAPGRRADGSSRLQACATLLPPIHNADWPELPGGEAKVLPGALGA